MGKTTKSISIDWILLLSTIPLLGAGLVTMNSFGVGVDFFSRQVVWIIISFFIFFVLLFPDYHFLRRTGVVVGIYAGTTVLLLALFTLGSVFKGAQSWFDVGFFAIQPAEIAKIALIIILAKYFSRRHVEIADWRHLFVSGIYAFILFILVFLQPDFGSAIIIFLIWFGMVFVSGISKKHLFGLIAAGLLTFVLLWSFVFQDYQKDRIMTFVNPLTDISGAGYNAHQSMIAVGSGQIFGKGVGYGTQSRLSFLPEYETDFIFAAFAEEWGFIGVLLLFAFFLVVLWRIIRNALEGETNFEQLFGLGVAIMIISHFTIHVGMNIGLLPITGTTIPFMSYGGSHLVTTFAALGILMGMRKYSRKTHVPDQDLEIIP